MASQNLVFMYGTLKVGEPNHERMYEGDPNGVEFVGHAITQDRFPLIITTSNNIPFLLLHDGTTGNQITGEVYRVNDTTMKYLDTFEAYPEIYDRKLINVTIQPKTSENASVPYTLQCWIYGLSRFKASLLELPRYSEYHSNGDHNLPFIPISKDTDLKDYHNCIFDD